MVDVIDNFVKLLVREEEGVGKGVQVQFPDLDVKALDLADVAESGGNLLKDAVDLTPEDVDLSEVLV